MFSVLILDRFGDWRGTTFAVAVGWVGGDAVVADSVWEMSDIC